MLQSQHLGSRDSNIIPSKFKVTLVYTMSSAQPGVRSKTLPQKRTE